MDSTPRANALRILRMVFFIIVYIIIYSVFIFGLGKLCSYAYGFTHQVFGNEIVEAPPGLDVEFQINEGESVSTISKRLEMNKLIVNRYSFYIRAKLTLDKDSPIMPGIYTLNTSLTYDEILSIITDYGAQERKDIE